ncbi:MAG: flagellar protein FlgN [Rhodocyclaceae bacterium]|jgi:flagella synthesis protein FlgN|nr:flagellar protein FlgN [Rhodocyclaceae bacterium]
MLGDTLRTEISRLGEFIDLLQREQALLIQGDTEALLLLSENKTALANTLAALAQERACEMVSDPISPAWQKLLELAAKARDLNATNGQLISLHMQNNQQALAVLMNAANRAMTYGPDGQQTAGLGGRILGSA